MVWCGVVWRVHQQESIVLLCVCNMCRGGGGSSSSKACWDKQTHNCTSTQNYAKVPQLHIFIVSICV